MKRILYSFLLLGWSIGTSLGVLSQSNEVDSLQQVVRTSNDSTVLAKAHSRLAWLSILNDPKAAEAHIDTAFTLFEQTQNDQGVANSHYRYAVLYRVTGKFQEALGHIDAYLHVAQDLQDSVMLSNGGYQKAVIHSLQGDYAQSLEAYYDILDLYQLQNDSASVGFTYNSIGVVYKNLQQLPEAIDAYQQAIAIHRGMDDKDNLANAINNLGVAYMLTEDFDQARQYFLEAGKIDASINNQMGTAQVHTNLARLAQLEGKLDEALAYCNQAVELQEALELVDDLGGSLLNRASILRKMDRWKEAEADLLRAEALGIASDSFQSNLYHDLYELYRSQNRESLALRALEKYVDLDKKLLNAENLRTIATLQTQFEAEQKDKALIANELRLNQQSAELERRQNQTLTVGLILGILLVAGIAIVVYMQQRQRLQQKQIESLKGQREIEALESFISGEEHERKRIAQDLHDGLNGDLSVIKFKVASLTEGDEAVRLIDQACAQVRTISRDLSPTHLNDLTLTEALRAYCLRVAQNAPLSVEFQAFGNEVSLSPKQKAAVYRMVQELVNNVLKHAQASEVLVQLNFHDQQLSITVEDNGRGFDTNTVQSGVGMNSLQSRADYLGAQLEITSDERGTSVETHIPLTPQFSAS